MFLYNVAAKRELQEGDVVSVLTGRSQGKVSTVIGFDLFGASPVVVQYDSTVGILREMFAANEVQIRTCKAPRELEPLPAIRIMLADAAKARSVRPCGDMATVEIRKGVQLTLLPKQNANLRQIYESPEHQSIEDCVTEMLKASIVTRLPHLIENLEYRARC